MTDQDRIKLAEAMGWRCTSKTTYPDGSVLKTFWRDPKTGTGSNTVEDLPDPFTDANDDYAVLEWMRKNIDDWSDIECAAIDAGVSLDCLDYHIGDYARAALKVIAASDGQSACPCGDPTHCGTAADRRDSDDEGPENES